MKAKYIASGDGGLTTGNIYEVASIFDGLYEINDDGEYGVWEPDLFEIVEGDTSDVDSFDFDDDSEGKE